MLGMRQFLEDSILQGDVFQDSTGFVVEVKKVDPQGYVLWTTMKDIMGATSSTLPSSGRMPRLAFSHRFIKLGHKALSRRAAA
jgi:hypothetical protein